jgi:hypothetical protein
MATATIHTIFCAHEATGTDIHLLKALFERLPVGLFGNIIGGVLLDTIKALPEIIKLVDLARSDPDNVFMTTGSDEIKDAIWPGGGKTVDLGAGQSAAPNVSVEFTSSLNISLFDDDASANDKLADVTIFESERGKGEIAKFGSSKVEMSAYYVIYSVE